MSSERCFNGEDGRASLASPQRTFSFGWSNRCADACPETGLPCEYVEDSKTSTTVCVNCGTIALYHDGRAYPNPCRVDYFFGDGYCERPAGLALTVEACSDFSGSVSGSDSGVADFGSRASSSSATSSSWETEWIKASDVECSATEDAFAEEIIHELDSGTGGFSGSGCGCDKNPHQSESGSESIISRPCSEKDGDGCALW